MATNPQPGSLIFGRTAGNENLPVKVNDDGTLDITVSVGGSSSNALNDGVTTSRKASVLESTANPGTFGLVALASDGADISGGGGGGGAVTVADGADVTEGATTDAKVTGDNTGTISAKLRGLNYLWALVVDTLNGWVKVSIQNASIAVTGTFWQATQPVSAASLPLPSGAATAALQTQPGVDIGDVTVNNAAGASAVNIQDGGNSITVDYATTGSGTATGALRVELPTNGTGTLATVGAVTSITNALPAGTNAIGKLAANSGIDIGDVDVTSVIPGSGATNLGKAEDAVHASGDVGVMALAVGNVAQTARAADGDYIPIAVDTAGNTMAIGNLAHDAVDAGNPVKVGGRATSSEPTAVASGDRSNFITDLVGKQITLPYANPENFVSGTTAAMTGTTSTSLVAAPGAGLRNYITTLIVSNSHATVGTDVVIQDGSGGTTLLTIPAAAVYGGAVINLPVPLRQPTTNTALFCANVTTGASVKASAVGYKGA